MQNLQNKQANSQIIKAFYLGLNLCSALSAETQNQTKLIFSDLNNDDLRNYKNSHSSQDIQKSLQLLITLYEEFKQDQQFCFQEHQQNKLQHAEPNQYFDKNFPKICNSIESAFDKVELNNKVTAIGGFGLCGIPENAINYISNRDDITNMDVISDGIGTKDLGLGLLFQKSKIKKITSSFIGENKLIQEQYFNGELEVQLVPQGSLAEKLRCGGAGIPAFFTPTGLGTVIELGGFVQKFNNAKVQNLIISQPKLTQTFNSKKFILEESFSVDVAIIKAYKADTQGNLIFRKAAINYNADMAKAAKMTIVEVEKIVPAGRIKPDKVHLPGIYVHKLYIGSQFNKHIQRLTLKGEKRTSSVLRADFKEREIVRARIARRALQEIQPNMYINLGLGIPTLLSQQIQHMLNLTNVIFHSENGVLGMAGYPEPGMENHNLINARKESITLIPGGSTFASSLSFEITRGGHLDITFLGAFQVSKEGDIANWIIPNANMLKGMGGAMDLVASTKKVIVLMQHSNGKSHKIVETCTLPLTGKGVVSKIITELCVFEIINKSLILTEMAESTCLSEIKEFTGCQFEVASNLKNFT